jgi:Ca2+-transporting ATPase
MLWHQAAVADALRLLKTDAARGLTAAEAAARQAEHGPNELQERGGRTPWRILWEQLTATMVLILIAAAIIAGCLGDTKNLVAILAIVVLYALLGFIQEYRAEQAIAALKRMAVPTVRVLRDGVLQELSARLLVPGDVVQLEAGNVVPADLRLLQAVNLRVQEAALTGESEPVEKQTAPLAAAELPLGDRRNLAFMGTLVTQGRGQGVVTAIGMKTELGRIADLLQQTTSQQTPLQRRLDHLGKVLAVAGVAMAGVILALGLLRGDELRDMLLAAVSVAVAIVPEGLPAVVTITLALGAQRMLRRKALIRKLPAVETLGSVTVICSDKTGTLTENRMTVVVMDVAEHELDLSEPMKRDSVQALRSSGHPADSSLALLALGGTLCNDATIIDAGEGQCHTVGDPTEGALVAVGAQMGLWKADLEAAFPRVAEVPFDSDRKRMTTFHRLPATASPLLPGFSAGSEPILAVTKGSLDGLLTIATGLWHEGRTWPLDETWRQRLLSANERLARKGMRVLGLAIRRLPEVPANPGPELERELIMVGLFGLIDPPRQEAAAAVTMTRTAGVRTVMITGDHPLTAAEIGRQLGIHQEGGKVLTGLDLDRLSPAELAAQVDDVRVFARVSPEHKLKIIQALRDRGHIVSMTGDGVNDAPALRRADIGVAMGITGTDVSKEAASLVLLDDNFATIVAAVQEGRTIYDNIRRFVRFSVAGNLGKVLVMLLAPFLGTPLPLLPLQLLWLNLLTDGLLGLGLGVEPPERDIMKRPPFSPREGVFSRGAGVQTVWVGLLIGALCLGLGWVYYHAGHAEWQTMLFTALAFAQVGQGLASRSTVLRSNLLMLWLAVAVIVLQLLVIYVPALQGFFVTQALGPVDLALAAAVGLVVAGALELEKRLRRA